MEKIKVMYTINGAVKDDVLLGTEVSIQRNESAVHVQFPNGDGTYLRRFSKAVLDRSGKVSWVSYADCDRVERSKVESDTAAEPS